MGDVSDDDFTRYVFKDQAYLMASEAELEQSFMDAAGWTGNY